MSDKRRKGNFEDELRLTLADMEGDVSKRSIQEVFIHRCTEHFLQDIISILAKHDLAIDVRDLVEISVHCIGIDQLLERYITCLFNNYDASSVMDAIGIDKIMNSDVGWLDIGYDIQRDCSGEALRVYLSAFMDYFAKKKDEAYRFLWALEMYDENFGDADISKYDFVKIVADYLEDEVIMGDVDDVLVAKYLRKTQLKR